MRLAKAADWPCGKRLAAIKKLWLPHYEGAYGKLAAEVREQLESISSAQIDRLLAPYKVKRGKSWTKPGSILKAQIPIRTDNWDVDRPGFLEADTVAHCGGSLEDGFIWSVTFTDICSQVRSDYQCSSIDFFPKYSRTRRRVSGVASAGKL